jgi:hypothetical protein
MLADTLQALQDTEEQAEKIIADAHIKVSEIEKQTYQQINKIESNNNAEIAAAIAKLPQPEPLPTPNVTINVPQAKLDAAVAYIIKAVKEA